MVRERMDLRGWPQKYLQEVTLLENNFQNSKLFRTLVGVEVECLNKNMRQAQLLSV